MGMIPALLPEIWGPGQDCPILRVADPIAGSTRPRLGVGVVAR